MNDRLTEFLFAEVWCCDFEFQLDGGLPIPLCMVAKEFYSGRELRLWRDELQRLDAAPFNVGDDACFVAYVAAAELTCFLALGWALPAHVLDLAQEHKLAINSGKQGKSKIGWGLVDALRCRGLLHLMADEKPEMIDLILSRADYAGDERSAILNYCASDVYGLIGLLPKMLPNIDLKRAIHWRGRYMRAVARMEFNGIPFDMDTFARIVATLPHIKQELIIDGDQYTQCYRDGKFKHDLFDAFLAREGLTWERTDCGRARLDSKYLKRRVNSNPKLNDFYEMRQTLDMLKTFTRSAKRVPHLAPSSDGFIRCPLWAFGSATGRNQPKASQFIFGPARWLRGLIKPPEGYAIAYVDWSQQEFALAGGLSSDTNMIADYAAGDTYWQFAQRAGRIPADAVRPKTAQTADELANEVARDACKAIVLGINYGKGVRAIATDAHLCPWLAETLHHAHKRTYAIFWKWIADVITTARARGVIDTRFGWSMIVTDDTTDRTLMNFPMQAGGAEMMQMAAIAATEQGLHVCCPVHDAFLIMAPIERIDDDVQAMQAIMRECSIRVGRNAARTDKLVVCYPDRYMDKRGKSMWDKIISRIDDYESTLNKDTLQCIIPPNLDTRETATAAMPRSFASTHSPAQRNAGMTTMTLRQMANPPNGSASISSMPKTLTGDGYHHGPGSLEIASYEVK
jgi:hypothetical protein